MSASADDRLVIAKSRACWLVDSPFAVAISRNAVFTGENGLRTMKFASASCAAFRVDPVWAPSALTSLNSAVYWALWRGGSGGTLNWLPPCSENGRTSPIHENTLLLRGGTGRHAPGVVPIG